MMTECCEELCIPSSSGKAGARHQAECAMRKSHLIPVSSYSGDPVE